MSDDPDIGVTDSSDSSLYSPPESSNDITDPETINKHPQDEETPQNVEAREADFQDEEEGECGFCLYMKGGECKDDFIAWENCIKEAEDESVDIVDKCFEVTASLKKCMEAHSDYYSPILQAEKNAQEEVIKEPQIQKDSNLNADVKNAQEEVRKESQLQEDSNPNADVWEKLSGDLKNESIELVNDAEREKSIEKTDSNTTYQESE